MSLEAVRKKIDELDLRLLQLLNERMKLVEEVGRLKREKGRSVFAPEREELLLRVLENQNAGPLNKIGLRAIYREILSASRAQQSKLRIVYLGKEDSHNFLAARMRFGASDSYRAEADWNGAITVLEKNEADVAVIPRFILCEALEKNTSTKPFSRQIRVCGEINLMREGVENDAKSLDHMKAWKGPQQFFIIANGGENSPTATKWIFLFQSNNLKKIQTTFQELVNGLGVQLLGSENLWNSQERLLCEVQGELNWNRLQEQTHSQYGADAQLTLLGTYPCPHIYG